MTRQYCNVCNRPQVSCICQFVREINNDIDVIILQHPSEVKQAKGTVSQLALSLQSCHVFVGENFTQTQELTELLQQYNNQVALLYPSDNALPLLKADEFENSLLKELKCLVLLDGTWKKAYRLYQTNPFLHLLPHLMLPDNYTNEYQIRKTNKKGALSTLEACCHALSILEESPERYQVLLENFRAFNQFIISFNNRIP